MLSLHSSYRRNWTFKRLGSLVNIPALLSGARRPSGSSHVTILPSPAVTDLSVPFNKHGHTDPVTPSLGFPCFSLPLASSFRSGQPYIAAQPRTWFRACLSVFPYSGLVQPTAQRNPNTATTLSDVYPGQTSPLPCEVCT